MNLNEQELSLNLILKNNEVRFHDYFSHDEKKVLQKHYRRIRKDILELPDVSRVDYSQSNVSEAAYFFIYTNYGKYKISIRNHDSPNQNYDYEYFLYKYRNFKTLSNRIKKDILYLMERDKETIDSNLI